MGPIVFTWVGVIGFCLFFPFISALKIYHELTAEIACQHSIGVGSLKTRATTKCDNVFQWINKHQMNVLIILVSRATKQSGSARGGRKQAIMLEKCICIWWQTRFTRCSPLFSAQSSIDSSSFVRCPEKKNMSLFVYWPTECRPMKNLQ